MPININNERGNVDRGNSPFENDNEIARRVSHSEKKKNKFARQKSIMDIYIDYFEGEDTEDRHRKFNINYDLMNGRLDMDLYDENDFIEIEGEKVKFNTGVITHYPLISQVANALHGEIINRPFKPMAKDMSPMANNLRDKKWKTLIEDHVKDTLIRPIEQRITQEFIQQFSEEDLYNLTPEQQMEIKAGIDSEVEAMTPEDIKNFMDNEYKVPTEKASQILLNYILEQQKVRYKTNDGSKHAIAMGEEYYYVGVEHDLPVFKKVNPKYFRWHGSRDVEWSQKGVWATYEQWLTYEDAMQKWTEELSNKNIKDLEELFGPIGRYGNVGDDPKRNNIEKKKILEISANEEYYKNKFGDVDTRTRDGQSKMSQIYGHILEKYGHTHGTSYSNYGIREVHVVWRDKRKLKLVTRLVNGEKERFWLGENYTRQPQDIKIKEVWVDEIWEGTRLGYNGENAIYVNVRPLPGQYRSIYNPFNVELPYYGKKYRTHQNNSKNVSMVDLGKPWQKEFDIEMTRVKKDLSTNVGSVFIMMMNMKPDNWKWQDWLSTMKEGGLLMVDPHKNGLNSLDPQMMKSINIGKVSDISARIQLLDFYRSNLIQAMFFNPARIGAIGQYATNTNIQQSSNASYNQTENFFETHREIVERAVNALMNRSKMVYKKNPERIKHIFDDVTYTDFILSPDFWYAETPIFFKNSTEELQKVEFLRQRMLEFIQNGMSFEGIIGLSLADTQGEITNLMRKETKRLDNIRAQEQQHQQQMTQAQIEAKMAEKQADREYDYKKHTEELASQERRTVIQADQWRKQFDVDQDGINDNILKTQLEIAMKEIINRDQVALKNRELDIKEKIAMQNKK